jgi:DNA-binding NtrC family response regulator
MGEPTRAKAIGGSVATFEQLGLLGRDPAFVQCLELVECLARYQPPILVQGETGTGKELIARALHYLGPRRNGPFVPINCGGLPESLFESELFGHEQGAFTDARQSQQGLVALAEGGTLFLDEVDSLPPKAQIALLRFLQDRRYRAVGGRVFKRAAVDVVSACNVDLERLAASNRFRSDLLYRINVARIDLPPLRERRSDIGLLAGHFVRHFNDFYGESPKSLADGAISWLEGQPWPGNIRELENTIHRAWLVAKGPVLDLGTDGAGACSPVALGGSFRSAKVHAIQEFERDYLERLMKLTDGNISQAARLCGKERRALGRLLKKHGINPVRYRGRDTQPG